MAGLATGATGGIKFRRWLGMAIAPFTIDGRSGAPHNERPYTYERMAFDVVEVMDTLNLERAGLVGWSDGACTALILAAQAPPRVAGVFFFACNMDPSGVKQITSPADSPTMFRPACAGLPTTIGHAGPIRGVPAAVGLMQRTQPKYSAGDLAQSAFRW